MKDYVLEEVWKAKESIASHAPGDIKKLAGFIKNEASKIKLKGPMVNLFEKTEGLIKKKQKMSVDIF